MKKIAVFLFVLVMAQGCQSGAGIIAAAPDGAEETGQFLVADGNTELPIEQLPFDNCPPTDTAGLRLVKNPGEWHQLRRKNKVGEHAPLTVNGGIAFNTHRGLLVMLGSRPTPGYTLSLVTPGVMEEPDIVKIVFRVTEPEPGRVMAQVVTYPCALVRLPKLGYRSIQVHFKDQKSSMLEISVP